MADTNSKKRKKLALGRGLDALLPVSSIPEKSAQDFFLCETDLIRPNRYQPRRRFSEAELAELTQSIQAQGILQPLLVRRDGIGFELIAGERRLRAAKLAGLKQVPVLVKDISDSGMLEFSIVENIQRENLNPLEESEAYHRLMVEFNYTQDQAAERVGKSRSAVANILRLRQLPEPIKASIMEGHLSMGHARALLGADTPAQQKTAWRAVLTKKLSVRETENLIKRLKIGRKDRAQPEVGSPKAYFESLADDLSRNFGTKVQIQRRGQKGQVQIEFYSNADLEQLIGRLRQS